MLCSPPHRAERHVEEGKYDGVRKQSINSTGLGAYGYHVLQSPNVSRQAAEAATSHQPHPTPTFKRKTHRALYTHSQWPATMKVSPLQYY